MDVVFVHGLGGHVERTWTHGKKGRPDYFYWPAELAKGFEDVAVWAVDYPAGFTDFGQQGMRIAQRANNLALVLANVGIGTRPLVFITHSMGGLIVKSLLVSSQTAADRDRAAIAAAARGVAFCATPHRGSAFANAVTILAKVVGGTQPHVKEMLQNEEELDILHDEFIEWQRRTSTEVLSFAENRPIRRKFWFLWPLPLGLVVPRASANPGIQGHTIKDVDGDHFSLVKPRHTCDAVFAGVARWLSQLPRGEAVGADWVHMSLPALTLEQAIRTVAETFGVVATFDGLAPEELALPLPAMELRARSLGAALKQVVAHSRGTMLISSVVGDGVARVRKDEKVGD